MPHMQKQGFSLETASPLIIYREIIVLYRYTSASSILIFNLGFIKFLSEEIRHDE